MTNPVGLSLLNTLHVDNAKNILDCGCGSGLNSVSIIARKQQEANLELSDLSDVMIKRAKYRLHQFMSNPTGQE